MGLNTLALNAAERQNHADSTSRIVNDMSDIGIIVTDEHRNEIDMGVMRDIQARRLPPNTRVPRRKNILAYLMTVTKATGSISTAIRCLLSPGSWTSSGGTHTLAEQNGKPIDALMTDIHDAEGEANFLEVGGGYAGLHGRGKEGYEAKGVGKLVEHFRDALGSAVNIHFTNLSRWHKDLPKGVNEHAGFIGSTIGRLAEKGVNPEEIDVIYSQCAAYFDMNIDIFIEQASRLLRKSEKGGYLIFNGKTEEHDKIMRTAEENGLRLENSKVIGGMNGTLYIFKKA